MKKTALTLALFAPMVFAEHPAEQIEENRIVKPTMEEVELISVRETGPYGNDRPFAATVRNNSKFYLDRVAIKCEVTDKRGFRVFKKLVFKSSPVFSLEIDIPPISTQELGIPPGATTEVGLYTGNTQWVSGTGKYTYDCEMYGTGGDE